jgi:LysM repeat protein
MNNPNPFVPKGSLLEQQSHRRSRMKLGVFCVLAIGVAGLMAMLIQGCKRETETADNTAADTNTPAVDTNTPAVDTNTPAVMAPVTNLQPPVVTPPVETAGTKYTIVAHDTYTSIAKKFGVKIKELEAANPDKAPTKLKAGDTITIPPSTGDATASSSASTEPVSTDMSAGGETYKVKSGDTLTKIAKQYGTTVKAIETENNLTTTRILVGQKLKIPEKAAAAATPVPPPVDTTPNPVLSTNAPGQ